MCMYMYVHEVNHLIWSRMGQDKPYYQSFNVLWQVSWTEELGQLPMQVGYFTHHPQSGSQCGLCYATIHYQVTRCWVNLYVHSRCLIACSLTAMWLDTCTHKNAFYIKHNVLPQLHTQMRSHYHHGTCTCTHKHAHILTYICMNTLTECIA